MHALTSLVARLASALPGNTLSFMAKLEETLNKNEDLDLSTIVLFPKYSYAVKSKIMGKFQTAFHLNDGLNESNLHAFHFM